MPLVQSFNKCPFQATAVSRSAQWVPRGVTVPSDRRAFTLHSQLGGDCADVVVLTAQCAQDSHDVD